MNARKAMLVYQSGIANVFQVNCFNLSPYGREAKRLCQTDFYGAAAFAMGMQASGTIVKTAACNQAGDISHATWTQDFSTQPFHEKYTIIGEATP